LAVDFETINADVHDPNNRMLSVSFSKKFGESFVVVNRAKELKPNSSIWNRVKGILHDNNINKIVAARPFDENVCEHLLGVDMRGKVYDVLSMAHVKDENYHAFNLENVANLYTEMKNIKDVAEGQRGSLEGAEEALLIRYNGVDTDATLRAYEVISNDFSPVLERYYEKFVMPVQDMLMECSNQGCLVDRDVLFRNQQKATLEMEILESQMTDLIDPSTRMSHLEKGIKFSRLNLVRDIVFRLNVPRPEFRTKTGLIQVNEEHLKYFRHDPFVEKYLRWKKLSKVSTSYLNSIERYIKADGRIYPSTSITRTVTGRTVMLNPPIQTYPARGEFAALIREAIIADKGYALVAIDLSQSELRIMGWLADDKNILKALKDGVDLHTKTAAVVNKVSIDKVTKEMRRDAKGVNFGLIYGMQAESLKDYLKSNYNVDYTLEQCIEIRGAFFGYPDGYYGLPTHYAKVKSKVQKQGYIESPLGRRRNLPGINSVDFSVASEAERQAINSPVQSFSSDLGLIGMKLINDSQYVLNRIIKPMWFIHDAIICQVKVEDLKEACGVMKEIVEKASKTYIFSKFGVTVDYPIESETKVGYNWANMKSIDEFLLDNQEIDIYW
jgi:DNA polymerase-1